jgi:endonuclease YncB( thermonuclease family)
MLRRLRTGLSLSRRLLSVVLLFACSAHAETFEGKVLRVRDGDSLTVIRHGERVRVRLLEIDAPELKQAFGTDSRDSLAQLCADKKARVTWTQKDQYGRRLGRVSCAEIDANAEQVRRSMAWVFDRYAKDRSLYPAQDEARAARAGLWSDGAPVPPWEWRRKNKRGEVGTPK